MASVPEDRCSDADSDAGTCSHFMQPAGCFNASDTSSPHSMRIAYGAASGMAAAQQNASHASMPAKKMLPTKLKSQLVRQSSARTCQSMAAIYEGIVQQQNDDLEDHKDIKKPPYWKRCSLWIDLFLLAWAGLFAGLGAHYYLLERDPDCDQPTDALSSPAAGVSSCGSSSILWRVFFFLACIPAAVWCSQMIGFAFLRTFRKIEKWAHRAQERHKQQAAEQRQRAKGTSQDAAGEQEHSSHLSISDCSAKQDVKAELERTTVASGISRWVKRFELSYLAEHVQTQLRQCLFMGINAGMWYLFWALDGPSASGPPFDNRFWIFFRVLVCLTLFLLANLVTRVISSFVGIKLKRLNHLDRMQDIAKREALLKLLVSKGVEHEVMDPSNHKLWQSLLPRGHSQYKEFPDTDCAVAPDSFSDHAANILAKALCAARKHVLRRPAGPPGAAVQSMTACKSSGTHDICVGMDEERGCGLSDRKAPSHRYAVNGGPSADRQAHSTHGRGKPVAHHAALRRPLSSLAKDVVEKHLRSLAKERHFLQPGLKVPYWNTTGGEDGKSTKCTADLCSEKQALILGEIAHDNVLHFLKQQRLAVTHAEARNANMAQPSHMPPSRHGSSGDLAPHAVAGQAAAADAVAAPSPQDSARDSSNPFTKRHLRLFLEAHRAVTVTDAESAADVKYAFDALDVDRTEEVTLENTQEMVCQLYKDRVNLRKTLKGTNAILMKLDMFVGTLLHLIFIFFYMLVFGFTFTSGFFEGFSALLLAVSFIFSSAISNLYENVSFVFLVHPFDVGDILLLNGVRHKVKKVLLSCTHFIDKEGGRAIWSNKVLRDTPFINLSRSQSMEDGFQLLLDLKTVERQPDLLTDLKEELDLYCVLRPSEFDVKTLTEVTFRDITSPMGIVLKADWRYCHKGIDKERCAKARSGMLIHAAKALNELEVQYTWSSDHPGAFIDGTGGSTPGGRSEGVSASRQGVLSGFRTPTAAGAGRVALATARGAPHSSGH